MTDPTHCPKCGHDLAEPLAPRSLFTPLAEAVIDQIMNEPVVSPFDQFWAEYPRKVGKKAAEAAFKKLKLTQTEFTRLLASLAVQKASDQWNRQGVQYVPHPATWLNQRRWEDDPLAYGTGRSGGPARVPLAEGQKLSADDSGRD